MASRKLTAMQKLAIVNFAGKTLVCQTARTAEQQALDGALKIIVDGYQRNVQPHLKALKGLGLATKTTAINLPSSINVLRGTKEFDRGDGVVIERDEVETVYYPQNFPDRAFQRWSDALSFTGYDNFYCHRAPNCELPEPIWTPRAESGSTLYFRYYDRGLSKFFVSEGSAQFFDNQALYDALIAYYDAGRERIRAESKLLRAMIALVHASDRFEEIKEIFPEAASIEGQLAPAKPKNALVAVSADDRKLLCENMRERGADSTLCAA